MKPDTLPPRVREVVSCGGLRADFFEVTSNAFLYAQTQEETHVLGREYLSLAEHEALLAEAVARARAEASDELSHLVDDKISSIMAGNYSFLVDSYRKQINEVFEKYEAQASAAKEKP